MQEVLVADYQTVTAEQPLVRLEKTTYLAQLDQAKAALASQQVNLAKISQSREADRATVNAYQASIERAEATLANAQIELKRQTELLKSNSSLKQLYDNALANVRKALSALNQDNAQKQVAE